MNARTQLALMAKARQVFESDDTFLSFPALTPLSYPERKLSFVGPDVDLATLGEFSSLVNRIPEGVLFDGSGDEHLWDVYGDLFRRAEVAESTPSPADLEAYERAVSILHATDADGRRTDSELYLRYKQHRDAWIAANEELRMAQRTAESGLDPEARERWLAGGEEALRGRIRDLETSWALDGRAEVETALEAVRAFVERPSSILLWSEWRDAFDPSLDLLTLPDGRSFAPTAFSPADPFGSEWPEFTLSKKEIDALAAAAPAELRDVLDVDGDDAQVERVSFQYRSVGLTRPWLRSEIFRARFWRLSDRDERLSDGLVPPSGACPAYVCAVVFARGITEVERKPRGIVHRKKVGGLPAMRRRATRATRATARTAGRARVRDKRTKKTSPLHATLLARVARRATPAVRPAAAARAGAGASRTRALKRLSAGVFAAKAQARASAAPAPAAPAEEHVSILAFVCKRLPACPDPDPTLAWPS